MATLRNFQNEIEEIHHRELAKQRAQAPVEKDKITHSQPKGKAKENVQPVPINNGSDTGPGALSEIEEKILVHVLALRSCSASHLILQTLLLSPLSADHNAARDMVAGLITQHHGEYVLRIGSQPPHEPLFAGYPLDVSDGWTGIARTEQELDTLRQAVTNAVDEVGGKVCLTLRRLDLSTSLTDSLEGVCPV